MIPMQPNSGVPVVNLDVSRRGVPLKLFMDIDWQGDVGKKLIIASYRMGRFDVMMRTLGRKVAKSSRDNIAQSRTPGGQPFKPLKNPRAPDHRQDFRPLFDSGKLWGDIRYKLISDREVAIGHTRETWYGILHQKGVDHSWLIRPKMGKFLRFWTAEGWRFAKSVVHPGIPQRKFLGVRSGDLPDVGRVLGDWATGVFDPSKGIDITGAVMEGE